MSARFLRRLGNERTHVDETRAIAEHLQVLLNAREGLSVIHGDYGLPDLTDMVHMLPEGVQILQNAIRDLILKFEPRLSKVRVRYMPSDDAFVLYFDISARRNDQDKTPFRIRTALEPGNRFKVTR